MIDRVKVQRLRQGLKITQAEAARRAGLSNKSAWSHVESGRTRDPRLSMLGKVARALGVPPAELLLDSKRRRGKS